MNIFTKLILTTNLLIFPLNLLCTQEKNWREQYVNLTNKTSTELRLLKNEVYARYGRSFQAQDLKDYFSKQEWYAPNPAYNDKLISTEDTKLINDVVNVEKGNNLVVAIKNSELSVVKKLITQGADRNYRDKSQRTALMHAIGENKVEIAKYLIDIGADVDMVKADSASGNESAITLAIKIGNTELLKAIIKKTKNIDLRAEPSDFTPLTYALFGNNKEAIKLLVENGADVNATGAFLVSPMNAASDNFELLTYFIRHGGDVNLTCSGEGQTIRPIFFSAIISENIDTMNLFLDSKVNINVKDEEGSTGLIIAARKNKIKAVGVLIQRGADINVASADGFSALMWAIYHDNQEMAMSLIKAGADVNAKTNMGWRAITVAIARNSLDGATTLIRNGVDINLEDDNKWTSLMWAIYKGNLEIINTLLQNGAKINTPDKNGWSPLALAANQGLTDLVKRLLNQGADININPKDRAGVSFMFKPDWGEGNSWENGLASIQKENGNDNIQEEGGAEIDIITMTQHAMDKAESTDAKTNYLEIINLLKKEKSKRL